MKTRKLSSFIKQNKIRTFLLDACGVLYNDGGFFPGVSESVSRLLKYGEVFVVTNNTTNNIDQIEEKLLQNGVEIDKNNIISSGIGLKEDPHINSLVKNKAVYHFGRNGAEYYLTKAGSKKIVSDLYEAEVLVMSSNLVNNTVEEIEIIKEKISSRPDIPVICCNPDQYILSCTGSKKPVIGYYAGILSQKVRNPFYWIGKPHKNFSEVVGRILENRNIELDKRVCFFDDNLENIINMKSCLGISGCCVTETGLSYEREIKDFEVVDYFVPRLVVD
ncbi:MAG: hypothetical protein GY730_00935 [bacterium]|nr:hypothetical protein [bacterium]